MIWVVTGIGCGIIAYSNYRQFDIFLLAITCTALAFDRAADIIKPEGVSK
jgi:hypothetical protein